ncbi:glycosyltransferase family 2 protein [Alteromonas naphthalenivorans]|uniref:Group 2 family glycosyl transferase n=2 Tax=Alteromonas TaxID=226 RepID=F5ZAS2_ALTNA|nr:glycosyltransferase family 2 protein [Alteromonas naphthalenivorans]AEF02282.1 group 2 family glycosyl transferase [Alteromonas naphthalenivorans]
MKYIEVLFWVVSLAIVYSYVIYPFILIFVSALVQCVRDTRYALIKKERRTEISEASSVTIVISAFNEESCIKERIENLLSLNYPIEKLNIFVASDGSTDNTNTILSSFSDPRLQTFCFEENRGKINVLNDLMERVTSDITVFSDANTTFEKDAVTQLVMSINQKGVGAVCGELVLIDAHSGDNKDNLYWKYEQVLKFHESRLNALLGANGGIYAIKTDFYIPLPSNTIIDDFCIVMNVARQKQSVVYTPEAKAIEEIAPSMQEEANRRIRIGAGNYQALARLTWLLSPKYKWRCFSFISHKVIRWFVPHFMIISLSTNFALLWHSHSIYTYLFSAQAAFYCLWLLGSLKLLRNIPILSGIVSLITFFVSMNISLFRGYIRYLTSNLSATWQRTSR